MDQGMYGPTVHCTVLPIPEADIASAGVLGHFDAPSHTIPSDHGGIILSSPMTVPLVAPGDLHIVQLRRIKVLVSAQRQGAVQYSILYQVCDSVSGTFGSLTGLDSSLEALIKTSDCSTYSSADETFENCQTSVDVDAKAGDPLGTIGDTQATSTDFGAWDDRVTNHFVDPARLGQHTLTAVCPYELFTPSLAEVC